MVATGLLAAGFWGAFFGAVTLMLAASLAAFSRSLQRVALSPGIGGELGTMEAIALENHFKPMR